MKNNSGFTLYELMVVIGLIAILSAILIPNMLGWRGDARIRGAVLDLMGDLNTAKMTAVRENARVVVDFDNDRYEIFIDNGAGANANDWNRQADEVRLLNKYLPDGVRINLPATSLTNDRTRFNNRGLPENTGSVVLTDYSGNSRQIQLSQLGRIELQ